MQAKRQKPRDLFISIHERELILLWLLSEQAFRKFYYALLHDGICILDLSAQTASAELKTLSESKHFNIRKRFHESFIALTSKRLLFLLLLSSFHKSCKVFKFLWNKFFVNLFPHWHSRKRWNWERSDGVLNKFGELKWTSIEYQFSMSLNEFI